MNHQEIYLADYQKPSFIIESIDLNFDLYEEKAIVTNTMKLINEKNETLFLHGSELNLLSLKINDQEFPFREVSNGIELIDMPEKFTLEIQTEIYPQNNTSGEGLYKSGSIFCTQNEAEGFRKITYYFDRPDMMSIFSTKITACKEKYPILLSNGNQTGAGDLPEKRHWVSWHDPHKKPCYLFALVAGDLALVEDHFTTMSGRKVKLEIYVDKGNEHRCLHAMESLKKSMKWDEEVFGLEYDLDIYMIVAVDSFNMGAMENKGLNIFNSVYVLADEKTAVDEEYLGIEGVIGHEYFHNWTGNRVTCRDWFQLTLKEGLTVFRDQEFSADMFDKTVQRIMDVSALKERQFPEDAGPMSHPIKPKSYIEINNFYTSTIYEKGAEVIRMIDTLIGRESFKKGITKYFEFFDGQAVTTEDFLYAMEKASGKDLSQFKRWYDFAGTPRLEIKTSVKDGQFIINISQYIPKQGNQNIDLKPLHIPFVYALNGKVQLLELTEWTHEIKTDYQEVPTCEWNLNFSAPVIINDDLGESNTINIAQNGMGHFSKWEAFQELLINDMKRFVESDDESYRPKIIKILGKLLKMDLPEAIKAHILELPSEMKLNNELAEINPEKVLIWRESFCKEIAINLSEDIFNLYKKAQEDEFTLSAKAMGKRLLRGKCLNYLAYDEKHHEVVVKHYFKANNMNDQYRSLCALVYAGHSQADEALSSFYKQWKHDGLVINKWLGLQARQKGSGVIEKILLLTEDEVFDWTEPNKVRSLFGVFSGHNMSEFHALSGSGYELISDIILKLDKINPQIGARIAKSFQMVRKANKKQKALALDILKALESQLQSPDCSEVIGITVKDLAKNI